MTYQKRWSVLAMGGLLIMALALILGVVSTPMTALADGGGGGTDPIEGDTIDDGDLGSVSEPVEDPNTSTSLTTWDLLLMSLTTLL